VDNKVPLIPREVLFGNPVKTNAQLSLDGKMVAYLAPVDNVLNVWVQSIGKDDARPVTGDRDRGILDFSWSKDNRMIIYPQDQGGNENWRLYASEVKTGKTHDMTPFENVQVRLNEINKHCPEEILVEMNKENPQTHDIYHLHLRTGELTLKEKNPGNIVKWIATHDLQVLGAMAIRSDGGFDMLVRETEKDEWKRLLTWNLEDGAMSEALCFSKDGRRMYLIDSRDSNTARLVEIEVESGNLGVIAEDPQYDIDESLIHPDTYQIQAVSFNRARKEWEVIDQSLQRDFENLRNLHRGDLFITSRDDELNKWLVGFLDDRGPISYYLYDRVSGQAEFLFDNKPDLRNYRLAVQEPISYNSRDGLTIHGFISYPVGVPAKNLPMVLYVHGGPWHRDSWGYDPMVQWLVNRGYVCLQVNFRGSIGYGKAFTNAGDREWGGKMHDDLVDAVEWAKSKRIADPTRIAIMGGSYGGYATLVGATFTPELFCCAVDVCGVSNLLTFIDSVPPYWQSMLQVFYKRIGNPETEKEFLKSRSPLFRADKIRVPILIGQGANDVRVKQAESEQIVEAMKRNNIEYEYIVFPDEGHGFVKPENRLKFYAAAERFLAKYLGGRCEQ